MSNNIVWLSAFWRNYQYLRKVEGFTHKAARRKATRMTRKWWTHMKSYEDFSHSLFLG